MRNLSHLFFASMLTLFASVAAGQVSNQTFSIERLQHIGKRLDQSLERVLLHSENLYNEASDQGDWARAEKLGVIIDLAADVRQRLTARVLPFISQDEVRRAKRRYDRMEQSVSALYHMLRGADEDDAGFNKASTDYAKFQYRLRVGLNTHIRDRFNSIAGSRR